jgi:hypothetical protein
VRSFHRTGSSDPFFEITDPEPEVLKTYRFGGSGSETGTRSRYSNTTKEPDTGILVSVIYTVTGTFQYNII